jgi:hypothetical protein
MREASHRRTHKHRNVAFVISSSGSVETLTVAGQTISFTKSDKNRYHTIHLPHAQYHDLETMARALIELYPSLDAKQTTGA